MSTYKRFPRTHKKKPDEFVSLIDRFVRLVQPYTRMMMVLLLVGFVSIVVYFVFLNQQGQKSVHFNQEYFAALKSQDVTSSLNKVVQDYAKTHDVYLAHLALLQEQLKSGDMEGALTSLANAKKSSPLLWANLLALSEVQILWQMNKTEQALKKLDSLILENKSSGDAPDVVGLYPQFLKAQILLSQAQVAPAQKIYEQIAESADDPFLQQKAKEQLVVIQLAGEP